MARIPNENDFVLDIDIEQSNELNLVATKVSALTTIKRELINGDTDSTYGSIIFGRNLTGRATADIAIYSINSSTNPSQFSGVGVSIRWQLEENRMVAYFTKNGQPLTNTRIVANVVIFEYPQ